jgi:hypothetical protein
MPRDLFRAGFVLLFLLCGTVEAAASAGSVIGLSGACAVERGGQRFGLAIGTPVEVGDTLQVPPDGKLKLRMADGSILSLAAGSVMRIDSYAVDPGGQREGAGLSMGQGLIHAITAPVSRPASFEINTAVGTAAVRSTDWFVDSGPAGSTVAVQSGGVVLASRATGHGVFIPQGSGSTVAPGRDPAPPRQWSPAEFAALLARTELGGPGEGPPPAPPPAYPPGYYPPGYYQPGYNTGPYGPGGGFSPMPGVTIPFGGFFGGHQGGGSRDGGGREGGGRQNGGKGQGTTRPGAPN